MTPRRNHPPNRTYAISRRTLNQEFLLSPRAPITSIVLFALARAASLHRRIHIHGFVTMSNHFHILLTDAYDPLKGQRSQLDAFFRCLDSLIAKAANNHYGRSGPFWEQGSYKAIPIFDDAALLDQYLYLQTNPLNAGQVARPELWPGGYYSPEQFGTEITVRRPANAFFGPLPPLHSTPATPGAQALLDERRAKEEAKAEADADTKYREESLTRAERRQAHAERRAERERSLARRAARPSRSTLPEEITFTLHPPPSISGEPRPLEEVRTLFRAELEQRIAAIHAERKRAKQPPFRGAKAVRAQDPRYAPPQTPPSFRAVPLLACKDRKLRARARDGLLTFQKVYAKCLGLWPTDRDVVFPAGTVKMQQVHNVRVEGYPQPTTHRPTGPPNAP